MMPRLTQQRITLFLLTIQALGALAVTIYELILPNRERSELIAIIIATLALAALFAAAWRGWRYAPHITVILMTLTLALMLNEPFVSSVAPLILVLPPIVALVLLRPAWVVGSVVLEIGILLARAGWQGVYANSQILAVVGMIIGGLLLSRRMLDDTRQGAELAAAALARQRAMLDFQARLLDVVEQAVIATDTVGTITYWNTFAETLYGWPASEALGRNMRDLVSTQTMDEHGSLPILDAQHPESIAGEFLRKRRDGTIFPIWMAQTPFYDQNGRVTGYVNVSNDISARKRAEAALHASEVRFRSLVEHLPVGTYIADIHGDSSFQYVSPQIEAMLGFSQDEWLADPALWQKQIHPDDREQVHALGLALNSGETTSTELRVLAKDGRSVLVHTEAAIVRDAEGQPLFIQGIAQDVTEGKRAEVALRESEARFRRAILEAPFPIMMHAQDGEVILLSRAWTRLTGYNHSDIPTITDWVERAYGPRKEAMRTWIDCLYDLNDQLDEGEDTVITSTGERRQWTISSTPLGTLPDGRRLVLTMAVDITERTRIEAALEAERALLARRVEERTADLSAANAELARAARLKDEFLANMSHELRTPLNAILGLSESLQEQVYGPTNDRQNLTLQSIEESGRHLLGLINDILDLAKIEAGKATLDVASVQVRQVCETSLQFIKQLAHNKHITVLEVLDPSVVALQADERRLKQILVNLLSNAVKFTPEGGTVGLEVEGDQEHQLVRLIVWDTGIGIAEADLKQLFKPFIQLDSSLARQYEGTGLGLVLVARMVELHGGGITVTSTVGQGSRFTVSLPWQNLNESAGAPEVFSPQEPTVPKIARIHQALIIDDAPAAAGQLTRYLSELGISTTVRPWDNDTIAATLDIRPDLIILDIVQSDRADWQMLTELKADPRTQAIPVLVVSPTNDRLHRLTRGADECLVKPFTRKQLQATLQNIMPQTSERLIQAKFLGAPDQESRAQPVVVLAEDNEANIVTLSDYLWAKGYRVIVARNGAEAIAQAREVYPDIILMDIQMPGVDGLEATRDIRADADLRHIPIIALTALAMPGDRARCLEAGANVYLSKPVSLKELIAALEAQISLPIGS
jgi:PAS domain S-box-containing protein